MQIRQSRRAGLIKYRPSVSRTEWNQATSESDKLTVLLLLSLSESAARNGDKNLASDIWLVGTRPLDLVSLFTVQPHVLMRYPLLGTDGGDE